MHAPHDDSIEAIEDYINYVKSLTHGTAQVAAAEIAVAYAERTKDIPTIYKARDALMTASIFAGRPDLALVHYSWMLAAYDQQPEIASEFMVLWQYKWIVSQLPSFPQISREQIFASLADMERRYERMGFGRHALVRARRGIYSSLCDDRELKKAHRELMKTPRDFMSDCPACVANGNVGHYLGQKQYDKAFEIAETILRGEMRCASVPHSTFGSLLLPYLKRGRGVEAMELHHRGFKLIDKNPDFIDDVAKHLLFLALTGNFPTVVKLLDRFIPIAFASHDPQTQYSFNLRIHLTLILLQQGGKSELRLRLPSEFPVKNDRGVYQISDLITWYEEQLVDIARQFDARNGNDAYMKEVKTFRRNKRYATVIPVKKPKE